MVEFCMFISVSMSTPLGFVNGELEDVPWWTWPSNDVIRCFLFLYCKCCCRS